MSTAEQKGATGRSKSTPLWLDEELVPVVHGRVPRAASPLAYPFTPTEASWLNQLERFFALLIDEPLRHGIHRSTQELEDAILDYIETIDAHPRPFRWTKSADDILAIMKRICLRMLKTTAIQNKISESSESGRWAQIHPAFCQLKLSVLFVRK